MMRRLVVAVSAFAVSTSVAAQTRTTKFEVASIRVNRDASDPPTFLRPILQPGGRVVMRNQTLRDLVLAAYGVRENELVGGPDWVPSTSFDLEARGPADMSADTARAMLRALLAERFSLVVHREQRNLPIYVMTMAARNGRPGPQLRPANAACVPVTRPKGMPPGPPPPPPKGIDDAVPLFASGTPPRCPSLFTTGHFSGRSVSMDRIAGELAEAVGRPVVNRTGMPGEFDLDMTYTPEFQSQPGADPAAPPLLVTALQEQLGLKLEADRGAVEVLVIDRATMPTEN